MVDTFLAQKKDVQQVWTAGGKRIIVTRVFAGGNVVVRPVGDSRVQLGFGKKKLQNMAKPQRTVLEKAGIAQGKLVMRETTVSEQPTAGTELRVENLVQAGDIVTVSGKTKGRGFAGVVKRHGFKGVGGRTHGQSDRMRAPGSVGAGTTPGRVWRNKRMAGRYGNELETLENRQVVAVDAANQVIWVRGTLPGAYNGLLSLTKKSSGEALELTAASQSFLVTAPVVAESVAVEEAPAAEVAPAEEAA